MSFNTPSFSLQGRRALITGAGRGIGLALAHGLAQAGAEVAVAARSREQLNAAVASLPTVQKPAVSVVFDVSDVSAARDGVAEAAHRLGGLDILINNAGVEQVCKTVDVDEALWDRILDTNLKGAFFCAQAAARIMIEQNTQRDDDARGCVLNVCSLTSEVGVPTAVAYGSSKAGLLGMTRALATEWAADGVRVNAIGPGYFRTALTEAFYQDPDWQQTMLGKIPQRRFGRLEDLIGASVFLCSDAAAYVTGQLLYVDGGYTASI